MVQQSQVRRWLTNVCIWVLFVAASLLALGLVNAARSGFADVGGLRAGYAFFTFWVVVAGLFALFPYLLVLDFVARHGRHQRRWVIVVAAIVPSVGLVLSQIGNPLTITVESVAVVIAIAVLGALYGAVVRLPPMARHVTLRDAE